MTLIAIIIYIGLQIVLLPLGIVGVILVAYKQLKVSQRLGVSQTAVEIINGRWTMDVFGLREDKASRKLTRALPNSSVPGLWMTLLPLYLLYRMTGKNLFYPRVPIEGREGIADLVPARTLYFDALIESHLSDAGQFVALGAGLDTRAYGPLKDSSITFFELDQTDMQRMKRKRLKKAKISAKHVRFIEVDFEQEGWTKSLAAAGFDPSIKTIFLWEGVTLYLAPEDISNTFAAIKAISTAGSVIICDIYAERFVAMARKGASAKALEMTDEGLGFGLDFSSNHDARLNAFITSQGLKPGRRNFLGANGKKGPYAVVVEALI